MIFFKVATFLITLGLSSCIWTEVALKYIAWVFSYVRIQLQSVYENITVTQKIDAILIHVLKDCISAIVDHVPIN